MAANDGSSQGAVMSDMDWSALIKSGEQSRLIPVVADMSKEERALSPVLAVFSMVPSFAHSMLGEVGGPTNQRAKVSCYSQVVFKDGPTDRKLRPDGFIIVDSGRRQWSALVEAKIGNATLSIEQIECYLDIARHLGVDAVITVSNQFAALPTHHPIQVGKQKLRSVSLFHFSWLALLTKATLLANSKQVDDPEQSFLLSELIRYLSHSSSGVCEMARMGGDWKALCTRIQTGTPLARTDAAAIAAISEWHQLARYLALDLSSAVGKPVGVRLPRAHANDPKIRQDFDIVALTEKHLLRLELDVPNAASKLLVEADFLRRTLRFSVSLTPPADKSRPTAVINWATRQVPKLADATDTLLRVHWGGRVADTVGTMFDVSRDPKSVAPDERKALPIGVEIQRVIDLAARFKGPNTFVEDMRRELPRFYQEVVQNVTNWVPKPPRIRDENPVAGASEEKSSKDEVSVCAES